MEAIAIQGANPNTIPSIGDIIWYSVPDMEITADMLETVAQQCNISKDFLPGKIIASDAFKRAMTTISRTWQNQSVDLGNDQYEKLMVRGIVANDFKIVKNIVAEVRNAAQELTSYRTVAKITFDYKLGDMSIQVFEPSYSAQMESLQDEFKHCSLYYNAQTIRVIIKGLIDAMSPAKMRPSGAVYFVPKEYSDMLDATEALVQATNNYRVSAAESTFVRIPLVDSVKQRDMVQKNLEIQVTEQVDNAIVDLSVLLKQPAIRKAQLTKFMTMGRELNEIVQKYEGVLEKELSIARTKKEVFNNQVIEALKKVNIAEEKKGESDTHAA